MTFVYKGGDRVLSQEENTKLRPKKLPELKEQV